MHHLVERIGALAFVVGWAAGCANVPWLDAARPPSSRAENSDAAAERDQLVLHADFPLPAEHRMIAELVAEREQIAERLDLPPGSEPIHLFLFADEASYRAHVAEQFPHFPERRAIFVETDVQLAVYAHWGRHVAEDLRHETAHGYLHAAVPNLPLWLDEGLAEYFEVGRGRRGLNRPHVVLLGNQLAAGAWRPNLLRLEQLASAGAMTQLDYAESWLWVHWLLESERDADKQDERGKILRDLLADLRRGTAGRPLGQRLADQQPSAAESLLEHLGRLADEQAPKNLTTTAQQTRSVN